MGDISQTLFGGSQSKQQSQSSSTNQAYPYLQGALSGTIGQGGAAGSQLAALLGLSGGGAQDAGFQKFRDSTGYQFGLNQGTQAIVGNQATKGLLNSGSTAQGIDTFGQNYADSKYGDYTSLLSGLLGAGNQSAGILAGAGNTSQSTASGSSSESKGGAGGFLGTLLAK